MAGFNDKLLEHFLNPRNVGIINDNDGYARVENPVNGYTTDIYLKVKNEKIVDIKFKTIGCTATIVSASALTEIVKENDLKEIVDDEDSLKKLMDMINEKLGKVPEKNWHCVPTAVQVLLTAILDYYKKKHDEENIKKIENKLAEIKRYFEEKLKDL